MRITPENIARLCQEAVGKNYRVVEDGVGTWNGTIVSCTYHDTVTTSSGRYVRFKIVMECGIANVKREFIVRKVPGNPTCR